MDAPTAAHPTDEALSAFALGDSDAATAESVARHLEECPACRARVAALPADDFLARLRASGGAAVDPSQDGSTAATAPGPPGPAADDVPPELLACPQYENVRRLGGGGMGVVYLATNRLMHRPEVLKVLGRHLLDRPGAADRFLREIRSAGRLNHPHVVGAYAAVQLGDLLAFAMEYVPGDDLAKVVAAGGPLPVPTACRYAAEAALGLQHAHEQGMVHRDIKPSNLILSAGSAVKVLDFGLAKPAAGDGPDSALTGVDRMLGTPDYVAPEQITDAQSADIRADVYSLGATLFFLLTGRPPFRAGNVYDLLRKHKEEEPPSARAARPDVPPGLDAVVRKLLAKDPAARYQTPAAVARAIAPYTKPPPPAAGSTVRPDVTAPDAPLPQPRRPRRWVGAAAGLLAAVLVGLAAGGVFRLKTADGTVVLENLPADAEVVVDGQVVTVSVSGEQATIRVAKGGRHRLQVLLGGREVYADDLTVTVGGEPVRVRLEPPPAPPIPQADSPRPPPRPGPAEAPMPRPVVIPEPPPADLFVAGSEWRGVKMIDRGLFGGLTTYYQLAVERRDGDAFSGIVMDNGPNRNPAHVTGTARGTEIEWKEVPFYAPKDPIHFTAVRARRDGAVITGTSSGSFGGYSNAGRVTLYRLPRPGDPPATDFVPIFDGRSLAGWETSRAQPGGWKVNQFGKLVGTGAVTHLYTRAADYADFHLRVRAATTSSGPAGVVVRSGFGPAAGTPFPDGHRALIDAGAGANTTGTLFVRAGGQVVADVPAARPGPAGGEWFDLEVIAVGPVVRVLVNGRETSRTARPPDPKWGRIALQVADPQTVVEFAAVAVKRLPAAGPPPAFVPLFNGTDLAGWRLAGSKATRLTAGLELSARNAGPPGHIDHLVTDRTDYADGRLRCQFRLADPKHTARVMARVDPSPAVFGGMRGYLVEVRGSAPGPDGRDGAEVTLSLGSRVRDKLALAVGAHKPIVAGEWNTLEVATAGSRVSVLLNGDRVVDHHDDGRTFPRGALALQFNPGSPVTFRRVEYAEFPASAPVAAAGSRERWVHSAVVGNEFNERWGVFRDAGGGAWVESGTDHPKFFRHRYTETARTPEYVELERRDGDRPVVVRLHDRHAEWGPSRSNLRRERDGGWQK